MPTLYLISQAASDEDIIPEALRSDVATISHAVHFLHAMLPRSSSATQRAHALAQYKWFVYRKSVVLHRHGMMCLVGDGRATADVLDTVTAGVL